MKHHPGEEILALFAGGDLDLLDRIGVALHIRRCRTCAQQLANHKAIRQDLRAGETVPPAELESLDWERLSDEMGANIRLGLEAAECVGRPAKHENPAAQWLRPVLLASGAFVLLAGAFFLNMPLDRVVRLWHMQREQGGTVLEATAAGIEVRQDGRAVITVRHPDRRQSREVSANLDGSLRASYVDEETEQVTIINVSGQ